MKQTSSTPTKLLVALNTLLMILTITVFVIAIYVRWFYHEAIDIVFGQTMLHALFIFVCVSFLTAILGHWSVWKQNQCLLKLNLALYNIIFAVQLILSVFALTFNHHLESYFADSMAAAINLYTNSNHVRTGLNTIQATFECCGVLNKTDWANSASWMTSVRHTMTIHSELEVKDPSQPIVPDTCCKVLDSVTEFCGITRNEVSTINQIGCAEALHDAVSTHIYVLLIALVFTCMLQLGAILVGGCILIGKVESDNDEEKTLIQNEQRQPLMPEQNLQQNATMVTYYTREKKKM